MLLALIIYVPVLEEAFGTYDLPAYDWLPGVGLAVSVVPVLEPTKWLIRRFAPLAQVADLHSGTS